MWDSDSIEHNWSRCKLPNRGINMRVSGLEVHMLSGTLTSNIATSVFGSWFHSQVQLSAGVYRRTQQVLAQGFESLPPMYVGHLDWPTPCTMLAQSLLSGAFRE